MKTDQQLDNCLPIRHSLTLATILSIVIAILMTAASVIGIAYHTVVYPREDLFQSFVSNDVVNLLVGLPILLVSLWWARRGRWIGLLLWPGALFYVLYNYAVYVLAMPFNVAFLMHLTLLTMSAYTLIDLVTSIDGDAVKRRLTGSVPESIAGGVLVGVGLLFFLRVAIVLVAAVIGGTSVTDLELGLHVTDFVVGPAVVAGGLLLLRRRQLGYVVGLGLLFHVSILFVGLILFLLVQPFVSGLPFVALDVGVIFSFGLVCMIPFALFARGVV